MSPPARLVGAAALLAVGALTIASLALVNAMPGWGVLFFYVLPTMFFGAWSMHEFFPSFWRRHATPLRRAWRLSRLAATAKIVDVPAPPQLERGARRRPERLRSLADVLALGARAWLQLMRVLLEVLRSRRGGLVVNLVFGAAAAAILTLVALHLRDQGWPLHHARAPAAAGACAFFLSTFALRALAWQRLFRPFERPHSLALVTSTGTAAVAALALPSRIDDALSIGVLRKVSTRAPSVGTVALSLFLLGLMDMAALTPFAAFATVAVHAAVAVRLTMIALMVVGVGAAAVAAALPSVRASDRLMRYRLGHWLALHAPASPVDAGWAWLLVGMSWLTRCGGLYLLLHAVGLDEPFSVAVAYVVATAAAAALPMGPAGAATQAGVGAAVLAGTGVRSADAVALAVAAQALTVACGAVFASFGGTAYLRRRRAAR